MNSKRITLSLVLLLALVFLAADTPQPDVFAKRAFDKSATGAKAAYERALGSAYRDYYARVLVPLVAAKKTKAADRSKELETAIKDVRKVLTDAGAAVPDAGITEGRFMEAVGNSCAKCHATCRSMDVIREHGYIVPGDPERSLIFTACNNGRPAHRVTDVDQAVIYEFIRQLKK